jgi:deazaflavin-dependent oxidoreductase (nitroreductase family)
VDRQQILTMNERNIAEFRSSGGRLASFGDLPVLLLTTTGAKSGERRTSPMMYLLDDDDSNIVYVFASFAGADTNPAWFHNVVAHPTELGVEIGNESLTASAEVLPEQRRAEVYAEQADRHERFAQYQTQTTRVIPVVALTLRREPPSRLPPSKPVPNGG